MANYFENTPKYTKWNARMALKTGFYTFVVPYAIYQLVRPVYVRIYFSPQMDGKIATWLKKAPSFLPNCKFLFLLTHVTLMSFYRTKLRLCLEENLLITLWARMSSLSTVLVVALNPA